MKKTLLFLSAALTAVLFAGCATVQVTDRADLNGQRINSGSGTSIAHINAQNWGLYFLKWPLITGSAKNPGSISLLDEDSVNVPRTVFLVTAKAKELGATKTENLQSICGSTMIPFPFPFLFYMKDTNVSGNAIR